MQNNQKVGSFVLSLFMAPLVLLCSGVEYPDLPETSFTVADFENNSSQSARLQDFYGQPIVLNFWASYCLPCHEEIPHLIELHEKYSEQDGENQIQVIGMGMDRADLVAEITEQMEIPYPVLIGDGEAIDLAISLGNEEATLPFTVFVDKNGRVRNVHVGAMDIVEIEEIVSSL